MGHFNSHAFTHYGDRVYMCVPLYSYNQYQYTLCTCTWLPVKVYTKSIRKSVRSRVDPERDEQILELRHQLCSMIMATILPRVLPFHPFSYFCAFISIPPLYRFPPLFFFSRFFFYPPFSRVTFDISSISTSPSTFEFLHNFLEFFPSFASLVARCLFYPRFIHLAVCFVFIGNFVLLRHKCAFFLAPIVKP